MRCFTFSNLDVFLLLFLWLRFRLDVVVAQFSFFGLLWRRRAATITQTNTRNRRARIQSRASSVDLRARDTPF